MTKGRDCSAASYFSPGEAEKSEEVTHQNAQLCLGPSRRDHDSSMLHLGDLTIGFRKES